MLKMEIGACKNAKDQISYLPISSYFWYVIFECIPTPQMQKKKTKKKQQQQKKKKKKKKHLCCNLFWVEVKYR